MTAENNQPASPPPQQGAEAPDEGQEFCRAAGPVGQCRMGYRSANRIWESRNLGSDVSDSEENSKGPVLVKTGQSFRKQTLVHRASDS